MIVAGVMSGTSADGINVALAEIMGRGFRTRFRLLAHHEYEFPLAVRRTILALMNATDAQVAEISQLNFLLGELYARAVNQSSRRTGDKVALIGCHGQTLYHQGFASDFLGMKVASTWQTGEGAVIAARTGAPVVSDFRTADMAAGGKGAPLVPYLDYLLFRHRRAGRVVQNIGGIGNLTAIPPNANPEDVIAFDTGPGNMVIDQVMERAFGKRFDRDGRVAAKGKVLKDLLSHALRHPFFERKPPRTAGREEFGREFAADFMRHAVRAKKEDVVATATALTARSIGDALRRYIVKSGVKYTDYIVSGGGAENPTLMQMLASEVRQFGMKVQRTDDFGLPSEAKEAVAFAVLAYQTWNRVPSNIPSATGAKRPAILGKISLP